MSNTVPYAPSFMPQSVASTDDNGLVTDQKMIDHMMLEARVSREQALIMLNCLYQSFQHNLLIAGKAQLKDLLAIKLEESDDKFPKKCYHHYENDEDF